MKDVNMIEIYKMSEAPFTVWKLKGGKDMTPTVCEKMMRNATKGQIISLNDFRTKGTDIKIDLGHDGNKPEVKPEISTFYFIENGYLTKVGEVTPEVYAQLRAAA